MRAILLGIITLGLLLPAGCDKDFLQEDPKTFITPGILFTNGDYAQLAVNGIYTAAFSHGGFFAFFFANPIYPATQEFAATGMSDIHDLRFTSGIQNLDGPWTALYRGINAANTCIHGIENMGVTSEFSQQRKDQLIAESKFLRAQFYFWLVRYWGSVPLHTEPTTSPESDVRPNSPISDIFDQIIQDLKDAAAHLPVSYTGTFPDNGRATRGAAIATLAKVYAQMSGVQFEEHIATKRWNDARTELLKIIDENNPGKAKAPFMYRLEPDFKDMFPSGDNANQPIRVANDLGQEIIFAVNFIDGIQGTWYFGHWRNAAISPYVVSRFDPDDYRTEISLDFTLPDLAPLGLAGHRKFRTTGHAAMNNSNNFYETRYAEILLLLAEVENEINNGPTPLALRCINAVRARARGGLNGAENRAVPADIPAGLNHATFKEHVFDERIREFVQEFKFWYDIQRSGRIQRDWANLSSGSVVGDRGNYNPRWKFFPIPLNEIVTSGGVIAQNPGH